MRAAILEEAPGRLHIEEIAMPEPLAGEVLVKNTACGVCHTDLHVMKAEVAFPTPCVLGHESSGVIVALGPGVEGPPPGTPVAAAFIMPCGTCRFCGAGRDDLCERFFGMNRMRGTLYDGTTRLRRMDGRTLAMYSQAGLAEYSVIPATDVFPIPSNLPVPESAIFGCAVFTAYGAVRHAANLVAGERVAVVATGGVGLNIIQVARVFGASQIIAIDVREDKLEKARQLGATDTINAASGNVTDEVKARTDGRGVDVAFEALGRPDTFIQAFDIIRDGGRMVPVGIAAGRTTVPVEITRLVRRGLRIVGSFGARTRSDMPEILRLASLGALRPESMITNRFSLDQADLAYQTLNRGEIVGRAIVVP